MEDPQQSTRSGDSTPSTGKSGRRKPGRVPTSCAECRRCVHPWLYVVDRLIERRRYSVSFCFCFPRLKLRCDKNVRYGLPLSDSYLLVVNAHTNLFFFGFFLVLRDMYRFLAGNASRAVSLRSARTGRSPRVKAIGERPPSRAQSWRLGRRNGWC